MTAPEPSAESAPDPRGGDAAALVDAEVMAELVAMRASIDNIDATLVYLLAERFKATQRVGHLKAAHQLPAGDPQRERNQIARLKHLAAEAQLDPEFAEKFLNFIIDEVIRHHQAISAAGGPAQVGRNDPKNQQSQNTRTNGQTSERAHEQAHERATDHSR